MVNSVLISKNQEGAVMTRIRNLDGSLDLNRLREIIDNHPEALSCEEAFELLGETTDLLLKNHNELSAAQRQITLLQKETKKQQKISIREAKRDLRKNLEMFKAINAKKPHQSSRETIRREMKLYSDDAEGYAGEYA